MKKSLFILMSCLLGTALYAQDEITDNGSNIQSLCPVESCIYISFVEPIYFPFKEDKMWEIRNMEVATKKSGQFLATGDLYVYGKDTAAILTLELVFISKEDEEIFRYPIPKFEFFNEPLSAEPIVFSGEMDPALADAISYVDIDIKGSELLPYYEIDSDCYVVCKELKLKEAMKEFKKAK